MRRIRAYLATAIHLLLAKLFNQPEEVGYAETDVTIMESKGFCETGSNDPLQRESEKRIHKSWVRRWYDGVTQRVHEELDE